MLPQWFLLPWGSFSTLSGSFELEALAPVDRADQQRQLSVPSAGRLSLKRLGVADTAPRGPAFSTLSGSFELEAKPDRHKDRQAPVLSVPSAGRLSLKREGRAGARQHLHPFSTLSGSFELEAMAESASGLPAGTAFSTLSGSFELEAVCHLAGDAADALLSVPSAGRLSLKLHQSF